MKNSNVGNYLKNTTLYTLLVRFDKLQQTTSVDRPSQFDVGERSLSNYLNTIAVLR